MFDFFSPIFLQNVKDLGLIFSCIKCYSLELSMVTLIYTAQGPDALIVVNNLGPNPVKEGLATYGLQSLWIRPMKWWLWQHSVVGALPAPLLSAAWGSGIVGALSMSHCSLTGLALAERGLHYAMLQLNGSQVTVVEEVAVAAVS